jgi:hypothetical protein
MPHEMSNKMTGHVEETWNYRKKNSGKRRRDNNEIFEMLSPYSR